MQLRAPDSVPVTIRPVSNDIYTFDEIFIDQVYGKLLQLVPGVRSIIDLGANIGLASIYFLSRYPGSRLLAVEPDPRNYELLTANLRAHEAAGRAATLRGAFWGHDGPVVFSPPEQPGHVNQGAVSSGDLSQKGDGIEVAGMTMPTLIAKSGFETVDLLKVDIEGGERHLFAGDLAWLSKVRCMALEFHDDTRKESGFDDIAKQHGFRVVEPNPHTVLAVR